MGGKSKVEQVANKLRWAIVRGEFATETWMPKETEMAGDLGVSRATLRAALTFLKAEGFVESVPGVRWRATRSLDTVSFDVLTRMFDEVDAAQRPSIIEALLAHRTELVVGAVAMLVRERRVLKPYVRARAAELAARGDDEQLTIKVMESEDDFFTALVENGPEVPKQLTAHQLQRAFAAVRAWLNPNCGSRSIATLARSLVAAIDAHDPAAIELAFQAATHRSPLYRDLAAKRLARCQTGNAVEEPAVV